jgi:hypothetical protein
MGGMKMNNINLKEMKVFIEEVKQDLLKIGTHPIFFRIHRKS